MEKKRSAMDVFKEQTKVLESEEMEISDKQDMPSMLNSYSQTNEIPLMQQMSGGLGKSFDVKAKQKKAQNIPINLIKTSEELQLEKEPIRVRITGQWFWKRVIVPPNAYVIHTRINKQKPVTLGLGISFRYKPNRDAYLIVPAAMQTIGVVANCISKEKQGINILAYVQWQIDDFSIAYKKLDFSDLRDPLGIVNAQLREQAEAAIKDKIATMSVEEVLTDKAPIIEELTARLKLVTEGSRKGNAGSAEGLGIKIATVQIREAIVCSTSLWDDLQSPFRHEQKKKSSISYLEMQNEIKEKELLTRKERETREAETNLEIELTKQKKLTETLELKMNEEASRYKKEQEVIQNKLKMEEQTVLSQKETEERLLSKENEMNQKRELEILRQNEIRQAEEERIRFEAEKRIKKLEIDQELFEAEEQNRLQENIHRMQMAQIELEKQIVEKQNDMELLKQNFTETIEKRKLEESLFRQKEEQKFKLFVEEEERKLEFVYEENMAKVEKIRQEIRNMMNSNDLLSQLIEELPQIAAKMPEIKELKVFQTNQSEPLLDSLTGFLQKIFSLSETMGIKLPFTPQEVKKNEKI